MVKYCALFSLCAGLSLAGDFVTGQGARLVIGQSTFTSQTPGASDTLIGGVGGVAFANDTLFVADSNRAGFLPVNNRILLFQNVSQTMPGPMATIPAYSGRCPVCVGRAGVVLGQPDFLSTSFHISQAGMRVPTAVASDGRVLVIADTENNRVLLYNSIPTTNGQPADLVLGQPDFVTVQPVSSPSASNFRGPQGVWIQNGKLFIADTQNNRVMIWNSLPTKNNQPADVVLGQPNFTTVAPVPVAQNALTPAANGLLNPVSVTSDGIRLYVADLGYNRVLIWNSIPTQNQQAADVEVGQKDFQSAVANDITNLCPSGTDPSGNVFYPARCGKTMDSPRFVLSDGKRLFVADGGNDRVLIFNTIPTQNAAHADVVLGQPDEYASVVTSMTDLFHPLLLQSAANITPTPMALAWDGTNLYVTDPSNRRILAFTPATPNLPITGVRNSASREIFATGGVDISGSINVGDTVTITIAGKDYTYKVVTGDSIANILQSMVNLINAGPDPNVLATVESNFSQVKLTARAGGVGGNSISLAASVSNNAQITAATSGNTLSGGESASTVAPGTVVSFFGDQLADTTATANPGSGSLPLELGGVEVYFDGIKSPIFFVSPKQVNAQIPWEVSDSNSISAYLRITHTDGSVTVTNAVGVPIAPQNPGVFAFDGPDPRVAMAYHSSSFATGTITISGTVQAGDVGTITIEDRSYSYTVQSTDTLSTIRDGLITLVNANPEERVTASPGAAFVRILLRAKIPGPEANNLPLATSSTNANSGTSPTLSLGLSNVFLCCANIAGAPITADNPALPGETIVVYATGLGLVFDSLTSNPIGPLDGTAFPNQLNSASSSVSSLADTKTANVIAAGLKPGGIGIYEVLLELNPDIPTDSAAQLTISQDIYTSNIVTIPVGNPNYPPPI